LSENRSCQMLFDKFEAPSEPVESHVGFGNLSNPQVKTDRAYRRCNRTRPDGVPEKLRQHRITCPLYQFFYLCQILRIYLQRPRFDEIHAAIDFVRQVLANGDRGPCRWVCWVMSVPAG